MPQLDDIVKNRKNKFIKRSYRAWDLGGDTSPQNSLNNLDIVSFENSIRPKHQTEQDSSLISVEQNNTSQKTKHKPNTQIKHKPSTNYTQTNHSATSTRYKPDTEVNTKQNTNQIQTAHKINVAASFASLSGIQRDLIVLFFEHCQIAKQDLTSEMSVSYIATALNVRVGSVKTSIARLEQKSFLSRMQYKNGRGGWSRYKLSDALYSELLYLSRTHKLDTTHAKIEHKLNTEVDTKINTMFSSSSSLNKLTTNTEISESPESFSKRTLPPEWESIDISPLEFIGFNQNKLQQIYQTNNLSPEIVQDSIYAYAFDMEVNKVKHNIPINFIMSQLKVKGIPYEFPSNYESPKDRAMRSYLEQKKLQRKRSQELKDLLKQEAFEEWLNNLPQDEQEQLVPVDKHAPGTHLRRAAFMNYYEKNIWPEKEKAVLAMVSQ